MTRGLHLHPRSLPAIRRGDLVTALETGASEDDLLQYVLDTAASRGWTVVHHYDSRREVVGRDGERKLVGDEQAAGDLDLLMLRPPRVIFAELKSATGTLRKGQAIMVALLEQCSGVECYVWRPSDMDTIREVLERESAK